MVGRFLGIGCGRRVWDGIMGADGGRAAIFADGVRCFTLCA